MIFGAFSLTYDSKPAESLAKTPAKISRQKVLAVLAKQIFGKTKKIFSIIRVYIEKI